MNQYRSVSSQQCGQHIFSVQGTKQQRRKSVSIPSPLKSRKSNTFSPVEMTSLPWEMNTLEVKSQKKRKRRKVEWGNTSDGDFEWANSLSECQLDLMVSVKQLAMERVRSTREKSLNGLLTPAGLRAIGIILEEFMMDRVQTLRNASTTAPSLAIDDLWACIEKSDVETNETKDTNQDKIVIETDEGLQ